MTNPVAALASAALLLLAACDRRASPDAAAPTPAPARLASPATCVDHDARDPEPRNVAGEATGVDATGARFELADECADDRTVREARCADDARRGGEYELVPCPNGCRDGACKP